jgi:hypothetical protein
MLGVTMHAAKNPLPQYDYGEGPSKDVTMFNKGSIQPSQQPFKICS